MPLGCVPAGRVDKVPPPHSALPKLAAETRRSRLEKTAPFRAASAATCAILCGQTVPAPAPPPHDVFSHRAPAHEASVFSPDRWPLPVVLPIRAPPACPAGPPARRKGLCSPSSASASRRRDSLRSAHPPSSGNAAAPPSDRERHPRPSPLGLVPPTPARAPSTRLAQCASL